PSTTIGGRRRTSRGRRTATRDSSTPTDVSTRFPSFGGPWLQLVSTTLSSQSSVAPRLWPPTGTPNSACCSSTAATASPPSTPTSTAGARTWSPAAFCSSTTSSPTLPTGGGLRTRCTVAPSAAATSQRCPPPAAS